MLRKRFLYVVMLLLAVMLVVVGTTLAAAQQEVEIFPQQEQFWEEDNTLERVTRVEEIVCLLNKLQEGFPMEQYFTEEEDGFTGTESNEEGYINSDSRYLDLGELRREQILMGERIYELCQRMDFNNIELSSKVLNHPFYSPVD